MTREQIQGWIAEGYHVVKDGKPVRVDGDIWEYLDQLDEEDLSVDVLAELANLNDEELASLNFMKNFEPVINGKRYSIPTIEKIGVIGGEIVTDPDRFIYVLEPEKGHLVIYKDEKFLNVYLKEISWDVLEPLFEKHIIK